MTRRYGRRTERLRSTLAAVGLALAGLAAGLSRRTNLSLGGKVAGAERVEDAVRRLHLRHSTNVIQVLDAGGPMRFVHIAEEAGLETALTNQRLNRLQVDGLVTRTGPRHGAPYVLTDAGRALGPVYAAVEHWSSPAATRKHSTPPAPATAATLTHTGVPLGSDSIRTAAALRRSTTTPGALFSHAPRPQPRAPGAFTTQSPPLSGPVIRVALRASHASTLPRRLRAVEQPISLRTQARSPPSPPEPRP